MDVGVNFFPDVAPAEKDPATYFEECLAIVELLDRLGFDHVRIVEHHFHRYGGYSPNPLTFLAAAAQRSTRLRLVTGAVLPVFNNPLKLAGEIGMVDGLSGGRLEVGFARAFLPHEFERFGVSLDESRARFDEGIELVQRLLEHEGVEASGRFHRFPPTTTLPRPTQQPRPPFWIAALSSEDSFTNAGRLGHDVMAIPLFGSTMASLLDAYRVARRARDGDRGRVMLAFHMFCDPDPDRARAVARAPIEHYLASIVDAASDWVSGAESADYPGYDKIIAALSEDTFDSVLEKGGAWVGSPQQIIEQARTYHRMVGGFEVASLQVNFATLDYDECVGSLELFASEVLPALHDIP